MTLGHQPRPVQKSNEMQSCSKWLLEDVLFMTFFAADTPFGSKSELVWLTGTREEKKRGRLAEGEESAFLINNLIIVVFVNQNECIVGVCFMSQI